MLLRVSTGAESLARVLDLRRSIPSARPAPLRGEASPPDVPTGFDASRNQVDDLRMHCRRWLLAVGDERFPGSDDLHGNAAVKIALALADERVMGICRRVRHGGALHAATGARTMRTPEMRSDAM